MTERMNIELIRKVPLEEAFASARKAFLENADKEVRFYENTTIRLLDVWPLDLNLASRYLLWSNLYLQRRLRDTFLDKYNIDTLKLDCILHYKKEDGSIEAMMPPYTELAKENIGLMARDGDLQPSPSQVVLKIPLLIDGIHRARLAVDLGVSMKSIIVSGVSADYPYMSYPSNWEAVKEYQDMSEVPKKDKKNYRTGYIFMRPLDAFRMLNRVVEYGR